jgi:FAD/FMN-containing dehydrogenase
MPDDQDLRGLSPSEHEFLFQLAKDAKIDDRLAIPAPKLDADEQEMHRFELLKGEVMAGNDNKDVVKELKRLLLKFSQDGRLNKTAVREMLLDMTALGY